MMLYVKNVYVMLGFYIEIFLLQVFGIWRREMEIVGY